MKDNSYLEEQIAAHERQIGQMKKDVERTRDLAEEQIALSAESVFTRRELEYCDLTGIYYTY